MSGLIIPSFQFKERPWWKRILLCPIYIPFGLVAIWKATEFEVSIAPIVYPRDDFMLKKEFVGNSKALREIKAKYPDKEFSEIEEIWEPLSHQYPGNPKVWRPTAETDNSDATISNKEEGK